MKLLIIKSSEESKWGSCKIISPNLHRAYQELEGHYKLDYFELPQDLFKEEISSQQSIIQGLVDKLKKFKPDKLIFIDHLPVPPKVIALLSLQHNLSKLPPIIFHIYGDFTFFASDWVYINNELKDHPLHFIVASHSQKRMLDKFTDFNSTVTKFCFPVNKSDHYFSAIERKSLRRKFFLSEKDFVIIYSGRVSLQKNVDVLLQNFLNIKSKSKNKLHLWIAGGFDDVGADLMGYSTYHGYMFSKIQKILDNAPRESKNLLKNIKFFGHVSKNELRQMHSAADLFVSLSLYHDEDYGMSPAEALSTGLNSVLTDWGGYSSFAPEDSGNKSDSWSCDLLPVHLSEFGMEIEMTKLFEKIDREIPNLNRTQMRMKHSKNFMNIFGIKASVGILEKILQIEEKPFSGFNWMLEQYSANMKMNWAKNKLNNFFNPSHDNFYSNIYQSYISIDSSGREHE